MIEKDYITCKRFRNNLLKYSVSKEYEEAKNEWYLTESYFSDETEYCICGHDIHNVFIIENKHNQNKLKIGICCIEYFLFDQLGEQVIRYKKTASNINRLFKFIYNLSYRGMIFDKAMLGKLNEYLTEDEFTLLKTYSKEKQYFWGIGAVDWNNKMTKYGFYLIPIVKKLCVIYHEFEDTFPFKTFLTKDKKITTKQEDNYLRWKRANIEKYNNYKL